MVKATQANAAVDKYHATLGWGKREVTVDAIVDGVAYPRRLDIADVTRQRAVEYKTGYQTANEFNLWEVQRDKALIEQGWNIEWIVRDKASKPLLQNLNEAGIPYNLGK